MRECKQSRQGSECAKAEREAGSSSPSGRRPALVQAELSCKPCADTSASVSLDLEGVILLGTLVGLLLSFGIGSELHVAP